MLKWFSELKVAQKLVLMSIFFLLPDSLMLCLMLRDIRTNIEFARLEIKGNQYLRPLVALTHLLPEHLHLARLRSTGHPINADSLGQLANQIDLAFLDLQAVDDQLGADLSFTDSELARRGRAQARPRYLLQDWASFGPG